MKKVGAIALVSLVILMLFPLNPRADEEVFHAYIIRSDPLVYSGGYWDAYAGCGLSDDTGVTYQWCARYHGEGSFVDLEDNERYSGTKTSHLRFLTADGFAYGTDWEKITFACRLTYQGKTEYTEDTWMYIVTAASLVHDLNADPAVRLTMLCPAGQDPSAERFEAAAGARLDLTARFSAVEPAGFLTDLSYSEMSFKIVTTVTENGTTVLYDSDRGYVPYTVGKGALTARSELWLLADGRQYYLVDSREIVIDTYADPPIGSAKAKQDGSLLQKQYNESRKVDPVRAVFVKDQWLSLLEHSGSWWKVLCGGFIGYVPESALNISTAVEQISLTIPEPTDGANPSFSPAILEGNVGLFQTEPVTWQILDAASGNPYINGSYRYQAGKKYRLVIWLKTAPGHRFPLKNGSPDVTVFVNGRTAAVRKAYEQDPEEVLELAVDYTDHIHDLRKITQVNPTCTSDGRRTYYHCSCGADYEDHQGQIRITDPNWGLIPAAGHWESEWISGGGQHYKVCQRRECMQEIAGTRGNHTGGTATCYARAVCSVCGHAYGEHAPHNPGPAATETDPQVCLTCGTVLHAALGHTHVMTEVAGKEATCLTAGNLPYYVCSGCGKWYSDAAGTSEITDPDSVILNPLGHEIPEEWQHDVTYHWRVCLRCNEVLEETKMLHDGNGENGSCATCGFSPEKSTEIPASEIPTSEALSSETPSGSEPSAAPPILEPPTSSVSAETERPSESGSEPAAPEAESASGTETVKPSGSADSPTEAAEGEPFRIFGMTASQFFLLILIILIVLLATLGAVILIVVLRKKKDQGPPKT